MVKEDDKQDLEVEKHKIFKIKKKRSMESRAENRIQKQLVDDSWLRCMAAGQEQWDQRKGCGQQWLAVWKEKGQDKRSTQAGYGRKQGQEGPN